MTEIKLTKRYPQSRTEDIVDAYMRGWNDALDAVQNGKFIINDDRKTENSSEKPNNCEHITEDGVTCAKYPACDDCLDNPLNKVKGSERLVKGSEKTDCLDRYDRKTEPTISKMEQVDEPQTMLNDGTLVINVEDATKVSRVLVGDDKNRGDLYYPDDEDEPQTDCAWR